ncbi:unnamed protein product [Adineta ricciae]|uniref:YHYH domain-containing protein n=1 Tax=Adineta ricciae TaxID=249248 RepID=A0A813VIR4_ADIRI|nr:unnamed protein product [Adineta ricciae]
MAVGKIAIAIAAIVLASLAAGTTVVLSLISIYIPNQSSAVSDYQKCLTVASSFATTVTGPVVNITATTGVSVSCPQVSTYSCPGSLVNEVCTWQRKLAITCIDGSTVRIRIQSNGLPSRCMNVPLTAQVKEHNIDFEVNFNPKVSVNSPTQSATTATQLNSISCNVSSQNTAPTSSNMVAYSLQPYLSTMAGLSIDNVVILNVNSADNVDPFYPPAGYEQEGIDECLSHPQASGVYHYHVASHCALSPPSGNLTSCGSTNNCLADVMSYMIARWPSSAKKLTVIGIANDGHIIYGPYLNNGQLVTSGTDICNGMFYDSNGNYAYFATTKFPYIMSCFGPGNYPSFGPNCTRNGVSSYTMSHYASLRYTG